MLRAPSLPACDRRVRDDLDDVLAALPLPDDDRHPTRTVRDECLRTLGIAGRADALTPSVALLELLFVLYDAHAFRGTLSRALPDGSRGRPRLRVSQRMTRTAGKTTWRMVRSAPGSARRVASLEIAVSAPLVRLPIDPEQGALVGGLRCRDRLDVLQRVFEHELVHVLMLCLGGDVRCSATPFRSIAYGLFGHLESKHHLTLEPRAAERQHDAPALATRIRPGDRVRFAFRGATYEGVVNRVTKRATVLVESPGGAAYDDGRRYAKFYVPLASLTVVA